MLKIEFKPFPNIETDRLLLREVDFSDIDDLFKVLKDPDVAEYDYFYPVETKEKALAFIERYKRELEENEEITWGIILKESQKLIGTCCLGNFDKGAERAEIGYALAKAQWGKGYATEAAKNILAYGFNSIKLNRIEATITPGNDSSIRVLEKLGFQREGLVRQRDLIKGKLVDGIIMGLLKSEFQE